MDVFTSAGDLLQRRRPERPVLALRQHAARRAANWFISNFPGRVLYAAKANDAPEVIDALVAAGIRAFDVASLVEMVSALYYEQRRETAVRASDRDHRDAAEMHRRIYQAIRARDAESARSLMNAHLIQASQYQAQEEPQPPARSSTAPVRRRGRRQSSSH